MSHFSATQETVRATDGLPHAHATSLAGLSTLTLDLMPDLICVTSADGHAHWSNNAWRTARHLGLSENAEWLRSVAPEDRLHVLRTLRKAHATRQSTETDLRLRAPGQSPRWFLLRIVPDHNEQGDLRFWLHILTDIHTRKQQEIGHEKRAALISHMLDASPDCIKVIDAQGALVHMNRAGCEALNVDPDSGFGMEWLPLLPPEVHPEGQEALDTAAQGENARFPGESRVPGEQPRYWDNMLTPITSTDGSVRSILCVSRDVTLAHENRRQIDILLHELNHRSRNLLTVIQALIRRSVPNPDEPFVETLTRRVCSISRSQDILLQGAWIGASISDLLMTQTAVSGDSAGHQTVFRGDPTLRLLPDAAERLGLAIHELTTNAIKYGALSTLSGTVTIEMGNDRPIRRNHLLLALGRNRRPQRHASRTPRLRFDRYRTQPPHPAWRKGPLRSEKRWRHVGISGSSYLRPAAERR
ncbi:sensory transduction histidine kinase [Acetobacter estunensis NRIC 0472]|uniref:histidine kinase n=1 Tax=Acetobacter estunensis TaxID=104097 RepID=A0A967B3Y6_9PROT|nr:PAS domain-containing protein [Acetobacter estunensis]NHO52425.1 PAS domain-containing protein [Acetobacter estunensis]GBQ25949.1 sensory transduction histidine kinase [Acetobacter estunensis NRIC 0472]